MSAVEASAVSETHASASAGEAASRTAADRARRDSQKGSDQARRESAARTAQARSELYSDIRSALTVEQQVRFDANLQAQGSAGSQASKSR
jgi:hypothetical protein